MKKEKYISLSSDRKYVRLRIRLNGTEVSQSYIVEDYGSVQLAMRAAVTDRDTWLSRIHAETVFNMNAKKTFAEVYGEMKELFPKRKNTFIKYDLLHGKYFSNLDTMSISKITAVEIMQVLNAMISIASQNTIAQVVGILRVTFRTARIRKYIATNPMEEIIVPRSEYEAHHREVSVSFATVQAMIDALENTKRQSSAVRWNRYMIAQALKCMWYTGIRPAEAFALTRDDVDLEHKQIRIRSEIGSSYAEINVIRQPKTALSNRAIPISDDLAAILQNCLSMHTYTFVFPLYTGDHFDMKKARQIVNTTAQRVGVKFSMYQLRHQFSTDLLRSDVDPRTVQELMGHEHFTMSIDYARSDDSAKRDAINARKAKSVQKIDLKNSEMRS